MRILGFSQKWPKLDEATFTTFRVKRRDKDWQQSELVQIVYKPRSKDREILGLAVIISKDMRRLRTPFDDLHGAFEPSPITRAEAIADGFPSYKAMAAWLHKVHGLGPNAHINKLTLLYHARYIKASADV
ncbi:unnamed protein product [marine sediment metagenome]|uniref:ASCH domain-containing protein n=1 Tax=marine sediment metagenome TaxID=412755 RepID=X0WEX7_9ZZZZ